ncbi:3-phosphoshikimate 1-carboxyvinyltransferase [Miniphocaeibacter massiliensis]|uniref:3-phosphoshikimate 1-carboxyvinyltransferase n=1 Tax=Miniphocaeibacter massiliensis TaxID=2041841 RepID=UPI000C1C2E8F|nr:3-phosphoshikimate 1-carboxyvinyltransferase [Miniphocaeibacter massiliensis]
MDISIEPKSLTGEIDAISSKSHGHRILICAALADKPTKIILEKSSIDIDTTISCLEELGAKIERNGINITVNPVKKLKKVPNLNCMESGSTFRFMVPVSAALYKEVSFTGEGRLPERPMTELMEAMEKHGTEFTKEKLPFIVKNSFSGGVFELPGDVSSQYISGLLLAAPLLDEDVEIKLTTKLESKNYVEMTIDAMKQFGVEVNRLGNGFLVKKGQKYTSSENITIEGDWSNAAFFLAAGAIGKEIKVRKLNMNSSQGDKEIVNILKNFGANVEVGDSYVKVSPGKLKGITLDISEVPDSLPILSVVASCAKGETNFINARRLRLKESDRLVTSRTMLENLGGKAIEEEESLTVIGVGDLNGGITESFNDHRLAMASTIASIISKNKVLIKDAEAVNKSYPKFYEDFEILGGQVNVI